MSHVVYTFKVRRNGVVQIFGLNGHFFVSRKIFILRRHNYQRRATNFDLYPALMVVAHGVIFRVPHLLCHDTPV